MRKALWLLVIALAMGLIAVGCGDDDDDDGDSGDSLSKEEFVAEGNRICEEGNREINAAAEETFSQGEPTQQQEEAFVNDTLIPSVQGQIDAIRDLGIPEGDEDEVNGILEDAEAALSDIEADPSLATGGGADPFADVNPRLAEYGLTTCAGGE